MVNLIYIYHHLFYYNFRVAKVLKYKNIAIHVSAMVVPGSGLVKQQAEEEGIAVAEILAGQAGHVNYDCLLYTSDAADE